MLAKLVSVVLLQVSPNKVLVKLTSPLLAKLVRAVQEVVSNGALAKWSSQFLVTMATLLMVTVLTQLLVKVTRMFMVTVLS